jgi:bifunctional non-homologous end joining protein LigD
VPLRSCRSICYPSRNAPCFSRTSPCLSPGEPNPSVTLSGCLRQHDGFRALAYVRAGQHHLVSRKGYVYRFDDLTEQIVASLNVQSAVLDGEIACLDKTGKSQFKRRMYRRGEAYFYAFDILGLDGQDLRPLPLHARKQKLKRLVPAQPSALLYVDHIEQHGERLFHLACREDLEGIVAKLRNGAYDCKHVTS